MTNKKAAGNDLPAALALLVMSDEIKLTQRFTRDQNATEGMPIASSSSSRMMIRGVTISIKLWVVRPMPTLRNRRSIIGILDRTGTPFSVRVSLSVLTPPKRTVPPSGTVTVVVTVLVVVLGS